MVELDRRSSGEIYRIIERVPVYQDLYAALGNAWRARQPRQIEEELLAVVNRVARGPIPLEMLTQSLGVDKSDIDQLYRLGVDTSILKTAEGRDGTILYSPYTAFENPREMQAALMEHGPIELTAALDRVANYQGFPVSETESPILFDAVARGLLAAPSVQLPNGEIRPFAAIPYAFDKSLTRDRKQILDKALAIVACVRCGQHFGGATSTRDVTLVLGALLSRECLRPHSSHERQYKLLRDLSIIQFLPDELTGRDWKRPSLIRTDENIEAVQLAMALLTGGEPMTGRESDDGVKQLLGLDAKALKPFQSTTHGAGRRARRALPQVVVNKAFDTLLDRGEL